MGSSQAKLEHGTRKATLLNIGEWKIFIGELLEML
jgi:hypothetical protein